MDENEIRSFIVKQPRGAKVLVRTEEDEVHEIAGPTGKGGTWAQVARSVVSLKPALIEVHDTEGKLLRAIRCNDIAPTPSAEARLPVMHSDPETARLTHFANLLYRATEFSTTLAFTKMVEMFQMTNERSAAIEARLERTEANYRRAMQERLDEAFERAEDMAADAAAAQKDAEAASGDPSMALLQQFAGGMANGKAEAAAKGKG